LFAENQRITSFGKVKQKYSVQLLVSHPDMVMASIMGKKRDLEGLLEGV